MEQTNPATGVEPASVEAALESQFGSPPSEPKKVAAPEPEPAPEQDPPADHASDELTPDDLPEVEAAAAPQSADDAEFEIVHNGKPVKLARDDLIKHAQQGFDYTQKTQALAEKERLVAQTLTRAQEMEQMQVALAPDIAAWQGLEAQLQPYKDVDWAQLARDYPEQVNQHWYTYQQLREKHQAAVSQITQKAGQLQQQKNAVTEQMLNQERERLFQLLPAWKDPDKFEQGRKEVVDLLSREGIPQEQIAKLNNASLISLFHKAAQYDKLQKLKLDKVKQLRTAPPVVKPGAVSQQPDGKTLFKEFRKDFVRAGQRGNSRTQESLLLQKLNSTFKL